jgi:predicted amidohydrolase YtcJ
MYKQVLSAVLASSIALTLGCKSSPSPADTADLIYTNGNIITMDDALPSAKGVAIKDGKILLVGSDEDVLKAKGDKTRVIDLAGKTMIPGFVDSHSHFSAVGLQAISANLLPPPDGAVQSIPALQQTLRDFMATSPIVKAHHLVIGMNYDDSQLAEHRPPTRQELDAVSTDLPIIIVHQSGHIGVFNSRALQMAGITAKSTNPPGGMIVREADGKTPNGVLQENAFFGVVFKMLPKFTPEETLAQLQAGQQIYLANGFTTVQDGKTDPVNLKVLPAMAQAGLLKVDLVSYADLAVIGEDAPVLHGPLMSRTYTNHFRIGGVKLTFDGSPQGKTAWFTKPYYIVPAGEKKTYAGFPAFTDADAQKWVSIAYKNNWQLLVHTNGDAATDELIKTVSVAQAAYPGTGRRTVMIHGQFTRPDQVPQLKQLGIFPSLFPMHTFYWGDYHRESVVGPERAENIDPTGWILDSGMKFGIHSDAPVTFPNSMRVLDSAVNRTTRSGYVLGPKQRLKPLDALKAMTIWPAYQYFEDNTKGSIQVGKIADLVILSGNPLTIEPAKLISLKVVETIKDGKSIYQLGAATPAAAPGNCAPDTPCEKALENAQPFHPIDD